MELHEDFVEVTRDFVTSIEKHFSVGQEGDDDKPNLESEYPELAEVFYRAAGLLGDRDMIMKGESCPM